MAAKAFSALPIPSRLPQTLDRVGGDLRCCATAPVPRDVLLKDYVDSVASRQTVAETVETIGPR
jgi:hypothetical protein